MTASQEEPELSDLSDIYDALKSDARTIIDDLHGGVTMWREAAAANLAAAGFVLILALTTLHYGPSGSEGAVLIAAQLVLAVALLGLSALGFRKYFMLAKRYRAIFQRARNLR